MQSTQPPQPGTTPSEPRLGAAYWEGCYQRSETRWDKGEASPGLADFLQAHPELERGTVLVPGCGMGYDVRAWAAAGFKVTGLDIAPSAIDEAMGRGEGLGLSVEYVRADFLGDEPASRFDWVWEHTLFCAIHPSDRDRYVAAVRRWLRPGGYYLAVNYLIPDEDGPPFGTTKSELVERFSAGFELMESWVPRSYANRVGLELMLWWRAR